MQEDEIAIDNEKGKTKTKMADEKNKMADEENKMANAAKPGNKMAEEEKVALLGDSATKKTKSK